jgi:PKD domain-containing protein/WD40 repeat protein
MLNSSRRPLLPGILLFVLAMPARGQQGRFVDVRPVPGLPPTPTSLDTGPTVTADELTIVFTSSRPGGLGDRDLFMAERLSPDEPFGEPFNLGAPVNSAGWEHNSNISADGLTLYFASDGFLYSSSRRTRKDRFADRVDLGPCVNLPGAFQTEPSAPSDGLELFFFTDRSGGVGGYDIWRARREDLADEFCAVENLAAVNSGADEMHCAISASGLALIFDSPTRSPTNGANDIWIATRPTRDGPFSPPVNINSFSLGSEVNGSLVDYTACLSPSWPRTGSKLYFSRASADYSGAQLYEATWVEDPPEAVFSKDPELPEVLQAVTFDGTLSFPRGPNTILSLAWDFGDGSRANGPVATHQYQSPGRLAVTLTVIDSAGVKAVDRQAIQVRCPSEDVFPWTASDIGSPLFPGSTRHAGEDLYVCAGGRTLSGVGDEFHMIYQAIRGDFISIVRITEMAGGGPGAIAGIIARDTLDPNARFSSALVQASGNFLRFRFAYRGTALGARTGATVGVPAWLRLERRGIDFIASGSQDGTSWTEFGRSTMPRSLPEAMFVGLAACGKDSGDETKPFIPLQVRFNGLHVLPEPSFHRGDANDDGATDLSDAIASLTDLFLGTRKVPCQKAADVNDDGAVDVSDAVSLLSFLFLSGVAPGEPIQSCGVDPTPDELACESSSSCQQKMSRKGESP